MRFHLQDQIHKFGCRITLDIELCPQQRPQIIYILTADMPLIRTGMHRNAISTKVFTIQRYLHNIRDITSTGIAQRCHLIYINA